MSVQEAPVPQYMRALGQANVVRIGRANLKRDIEDKARFAADVVLAPPAVAITMPLVELLMAQHLWGRVRARRFLRSVQLSESKTIGSLSDRQRQLVADRLRHGR